jgi:dihydroxyacetone kinase-like predicted kinase
MPKVLDGPTLADALRGMHAALHTYEDELNRINVFPVPDGDTGSNMAATLEGIVAALADAHTLREVAAAVAGGALTAATGNSGIILGQALDGLCGAWSALDQVGPCDLRRGFRAASDRARQAVLDPVEGTILTVARATADALDAAADRSVPGLLAVAAGAADAAVAATSDQLDALRAAGVVDAAGRGYELCVRALAAAVGAVPFPAPPAPVGDGRAGHRPGGAGPGPAAARGPAYEVQYLLEAPATAVAGLRETLGGLGESVAIGGGGGSWSVHVHTDDAGAAIEAALRYGTPSRIRVSSLRGPRSG